jgi:hypothetical protein
MRSPHPATRGKLAATRGKLAATRGKFPATRGKLAVARMALDDFREPSAQAVNDVAAVDANDLKRQVWPVEGHDIVGLVFLAKLFQSLGP